MQKGRSVSCGASEGKNEILLKRGCKKWFHFLRLLFLKNKKAQNEYYKLSDERGGEKMMPRRCCGRRCKRPCQTAGIIFICLGAGLFLAYIIPYYLLISVLGLYLICMGICFIIRK